MAVSQNTQRGMYGDHATLTEYVKTRHEADLLAHEWRQSGYYRKVQVYSWDNGSKQTPRTEYKVCGWVARQRHQKGPTHA